MVKTLVLTTIIAAVVGVIFSRLTEGTLNALFSAVGDHNFCGGSNDFAGN